MNTEGWGTPPTAEGGIGHNSGAWPTAEAQAAPPAVTYEVKYPAQPETEEPEAFRLRRNAEVDAWLRGKQAATMAVDLERDCRAKVTATLFPAPKKGTQRYDIGGGYQVKLVYGLTFTLGNKDALRESDGSKYPIREQVEDLEARIMDKHGEVGAALIKRLISWKPELSGSEYEKLDPKDDVEASVAAMIAEILTVKPASPQLTFEEPKAAK
jgi:hypothetical protein